MKKEFLNEYLANDGTPSIGVSVFFAVNQINENALILLFSTLY